MLANNNTIQGPSNGGDSVFKSTASVVSAKSSLSKLSKRSEQTVDAFAISQATAQAMNAAKAILENGGSELTALKTAKTAAMSALLPDSSENDTFSSIGTSFLRRRKLKRQAEIVASMALASAMAQINSQTHKKKLTEWNSVSSNLSLQGPNLLNGTSSTESAKTQGSAAHDRYYHQLSNNKPKVSAGDMISQHLKNLPNFSSTFSGEGLSMHHPGSTDYNGQNTSFLGSNSRRSRNRARNIQAKCKLFSGHTDCFHHEYSDNSVESSDYTATTADTMFLTIANVLSCGPKRPTEVIFPRIDEEEEITFDGFEADDDDCSDEGHSFPSVVDQSYGSIPQANAASTQNILRDLEASTRDRNSTQSPVTTKIYLSIQESATAKSEDIEPADVIETIDDTIEMTADLSIADLSTDSPDRVISDGPVETDLTEDEDAQYIQIVAPQKRNRRLTRSYNKVQNHDPPESTGSSKMPKTASKTRNLLRKWRK